MLRGAHARGRTSRIINSLIVCDDRKAGNAQPRWSSVVWEDCWHQQNHGRGCLLLGAKQQCCGKTHETVLRMWGSQEGWNRERRDPWLGFYLLGGRFFLSWSIWLEVWTYHNISQDAIVHYMVTFRETELTTKPFQFFYSIVSLRLYPQF